MYSLHRKYHTERLKIVTKVKWSSFQLLGKAGIKTAHILLNTYMYYISMIWLNYVITTRLFIRPGSELVNCSTNAQEDPGPPLAACKGSSDCQCLKGCLLLPMLSVISPK